MVHNVQVGASGDTARERGQTRYQAMDICLVSFPYSSTRHTGRGLDRYTCELAENIVAEAPNARLRLVDQGSSGSVLEAGKKVLGFARNVFSRRADIYHAISPLGGAMLAALGRKPLVTTIHDVIPFNVDSTLDSPLKYRYWRQCIRTSISQGAAVIVPYQVTKDEIVNRLDGDPNKVFVVNHGVDHELYFHRPNVARAKNKIVYLGEVSRSKGVDLLLKAFAIVRRRVPDAELVIAGKRNKDQEMLEELTARLGVGGITHMGYIHERELPDYYATASVMVFPSRCGFGLSTLEAMACGTPVVALSVLDAPEFIGDAGILVEPDNEEALATELVRVISEPEVAGRLQGKGLARSREFSWARMARETLAVYEYALQR